LAINNHGGPPLPAGAILITSNRFRYFRLWSWLLPRFAATTLYFASTTCACA